ncbi:phenylalanine--tRNA ligase subunit beta [Halothiobacillus sp.]|uniref:phenylalanine--tRNA ligase subunit beta n=1 Tax=Halothiobacillus sp. TaxID=1891311 RepID=UPI002AD32C23|nr:phenylalanine--tRNA ligase subunit beta [Halothiobacillus sp.]
MRFSEQWLREWIDPAVDTATLAHRLTMAGLEVDAIEPAAPAFTGIVVGEVLSVARHPEADKLNITRVTDGDAEYQVVCGAPNVQAGMRVPFARIGAVLPGGMTIQQAKLRGVASSGMLCSATELGLPSDRDGLWALPDDAPVGADIRAWLKLDDSVIELGITPNRGDALSILGLARECATLFDQPYTGPAFQPPVVASAESVRARIAVPDDCPQYLTQTISGIPTDRRTPLWLAERLRRAGIKVIEPIVDICNYVMLEQGQPLHAFDGHKLQGDLVVRRAQAQEPLMALNQQALVLDESCLVIADARGAVALAGIIGGLESAVDARTDRIVLESAHFVPAVIVGRARAFGLTTDASFRFERGVDPCLPEHALARAAELIVGLLGGTAGPISVAAGGWVIPIPAAIPLDLSWAERRLGLAVSMQTATQYLSALGCVVSGETSGVLQVSPPAHRFDLAIPEDLLEELARLIGFDAFRAPMGRAPLTIRREPETMNTPADVADIMSGLGFFEAITYSFIDPAIAELVTSEAPIRLANPISSEMAVMRQSLWPGLLQAIRFNQNRQQGRVRLFEVGRVFTGDLDHVVETDQLAAAVCGSRLPEQWGDKEAPVDFFDLKGDVEAMLLGLGFALSPGADERSVVTFQSGRHTALHPGQTAEILIDGVPEGWIGALHPQLVERLDLVGPVYVFSLNMARLHQRGLPANRPLSRFPQVRRDLALLKPDHLPAAVLLDLIRQDAPESLRAVGLFDRYVGTGIEPGYESIALKLVFQNYERTLTDEEIIAIISDIRAKLAQHDIYLRS